jgi:hypothetical protein
MEKAAVADLPEAIGPDVLEEPPEKLHDVEVGRAWACTAHCTVSERDGAVLARDEATVGDGDPEDIRGKGGASGVAVVIGLTVDVPGNGPDLWGDGLSQSGLAHVFFAQSAGDGGEGCDRDTDIGSRRQPRCAVRGEATARDDRVDVGVVLELPAPGVQDTSEPREIGPDAARGCGQPFEGRGRRLQHGLVGEALMRAEKGPQGLRDGEGEEAGRSGQLFFQVVREPLLGCMLLTLRAMTSATGMIDAVVPSTIVALREARSVMATLARSDSADGCAVRGGEVGRARKVCWRKGGKDIAEGGHGRSPCMRALRRS